MFTFSIGVAGFCIAVGITFFGVLMNRLIPASHSVLAPVYIAVIGALALFAQILMPHAVASDNSVLLLASAVAVGLGSGAIYLASVDVLQAWVPEAPGLITGVGMLCGGVGSLIGIRVDIVLTQLLGDPLLALGVSGAIAGVVALASAVLVCRPPPDWTPTSIETASSVSVMDEECGTVSSHSDSELAALLPLSTLELMRNCPQLTVKDILTDRSFYLLLVAFAAAVGPGFGFVLAFQKMAYTLFGVSMAEANRLYFWVTFAGVAGRLATGWTVDKLQSLDSRDEDSLYGARKTNVILLVGQTIALLAIPVSIHNGHVGSFTVASAAVYVTFSGGVVVAACMVRGIYMPRNASLGFSLVAVSIGFGDVFFSWIVAWCGDLSDVEKSYASAISSGVISEARQGDYNVFLFFGLLWSLCGLAASLCIEVSPTLMAHGDGETTPGYDSCD